MRFARTLFVVRYLGIYSWQVYIVNKNIYLIFTTSVTSIRVVNPFDMYIEIRNIFSYFSSK